MKQESQLAAPSIVKEIEGGKVHPVYLLCGDESFLIENTLKQMLDCLLETNDSRFQLKSS